MLVRSGSVPDAPRPAVLVVSVLMTCLSWGELGWCRRDRATGSGGGPAAVQGERGPGHRGRGRAAQEDHRVGDLLGLDEPLQRGAGEEDGVEDLVLGDAVGARLVGELALDQRRTDVAG